MSLAQICQSLRVMTSLKGVLDAPADPEEQRIIPHLDLSDKYTPLEQHDMKLATGLLSKLLVRSVQSDIAAVAWVHVPAQNQFHLLFSNNKSTVTDRDSSDAHSDRARDRAHAGDLINILQAQYDAQLSASKAGADPKVFVNMKEEHMSRILRFAASTDCANLLQRKLAGFGPRLGHYDISQDEKETERGNLRLILSSASAKAFNDSYSLRTAELTAAEIGIREYLVRSMQPPPQPMPTRATIMTAAMEYMATLDLQPRIISFGDYEGFPEFIQFCDDLAHSALMAHLHDNPPRDKQEEKTVSKLRRRLDRICGYRAGAKAIVGGMFEYFRRVTPAAHRHKLELSCRYVADHFRDVLGVTRTYSVTTPQFLKRLVEFEAIPAVWLEKSLWKKGAIVPSGSIHAELRLVLYCVSKGFVIDYLGVSKQPCYSCHIYLKRLAKLIMDDPNVPNPTWVTSGCSWKPHPGWGIPMFELSPQTGDNRFPLTQGVLTNLAQHVDDKLYAEASSIARRSRDGDIEGPMSGSDSSNHGSDLEV